MADSNINTKDILVIAWCYAENDESVDYLVKTIDMFIRQLDLKVLEMKHQLELMDIKRQTEFPYKMTKMGERGIEIDIIQGKIFELTGALVAVLNKFHNEKLEW